MYLYPMYVIIDEIMVTSIAIPDLMEPSVDSTLISRSW